MHSGVRKRKSLELLRMLCIKSLKKPDVGNGSAHTYSHTHTHTHTHACTHMYAHTHTHQETFCLPKGLICFLFKNTEI